MHWIANLITGLKSIVHKQQVERELDEELNGFIEASTAHKQDCGMTAEQARRAALVEVGSRNVVKHRVWSAHWESTFESVLQDLRIGIRTLAKSPGFAAVAVTLNRARSRRQYRYLHSDSSVDASRSSCA